MFSFSTETGVEDYVYVKNNDKFSFATSAVKDEDLAKAYNSANNVTLFHRSTLH